MDSLGLLAGAKKTVETRIDYIKKYLPKCKDKADVDLGLAFDNTATFMSEICKYESYLVKNFPNMSLKNRGVLLIKVVLLVNEKQKCSNYCIG